MLKPSPDAPFPPLYQENPTSRTSFITIPNIIIFFPNPHPCQIWTNHVSRVQSTPYPTLYFGQIPNPLIETVRSFSTLRRRLKVSLGVQTFKMCLKLSQWLLTGYYIFHNIVVLSRMYMKLNIPCSHVDRLTAIDIWNKQWKDNAGQTF